MTRRADRDCRLSRSAARCSLSPRPHRLRARTADQRRRRSSSSSPAMRGRNRPAAQGFSVVLVVGDLQGPAGEEDVPPAARRALADMKDFLPYKSYKLVDAAWIMGSTHASSRLRGPDDREYEIEISVSDGRMSRLAGRRARRPPPATRASACRSRCARRADARAVGATAGRGGTRRRHDGAAPRGAARGAARPAARGAHALQRVTPGSRAARPGDCRPCRPKLQDAQHAAEAAARRRRARARSGGRS